MPSARQKRILANRQSAARSKERKLAYISELEAQVSSLTVQLTTASLQLRSLQQDTTSLGECNATLAQQALVLREHMAQRDAETASLAAELRRAQGILAAHNLQDGAPSSGGGNVSGGNGCGAAALPPLSVSPRPAEGNPGGTEGGSGDVQERASTQPMGRLRQWTHAQAQQQEQLNQQQMPLSDGQAQSLPVAAPLEQQQVAGGEQQLQPQGNVSDLLRQLQGNYPAQTTGSDGVSGQPLTVRDSGTTMATDAAPAVDPDMEQLVADYTAAARARAVAQPQAHGNGSGGGAFGSGRSSFTGYKANVG